MKQTRLRDILTDREIQQAINRWHTNDQNFAQWVTENLIKPNIDRINLHLGQENDPRFLGYLIEHVFRSNSR